MSQTSFAWQGGRRQLDNVGDGKMVFNLDHYFLGHGFIYHNYAIIAELNGWDFSVGDCTIDDLGYQYYDGDYVRVEEQRAFGETKESYEDNKEAGEYQEDYNYNGNHGHYHQPAGENKSDSSNYYNGNHGHYHQQAGARKSDLFTYYHNGRNGIYNAAENRMVKEIISPIYENEYGYIGNYVPSDEVLADVIGHFIEAQATGGLF